MGIVNIRDAMNRGISSVGTKVKNIGRGISESRERFNTMIGVNLSRRNLAIGTALGVTAGIAGATLLTRYSGSLENNDTGTGIVGNNLESNRFGSLNSNLGYNRIEGLKK